MGVSYSTDYCATPFLCYILDYKFFTQNWWKWWPVRWFQGSINWTSLFGGKGVTEGAGVRFSDQFLWTHSRDRASFFWNSSSWSWLSRFLLRRLGEQKHVGLEKRVTVSWFSVFVPCVCVWMCLCALTASPAPSGHQKLLSQRYRSGSPSDDCNKKQRWICFKNKHSAQMHFHCFFVCLCAFLNCVLVLNTW